ncbi:MAG: DnaJ domain-containing protein [Pseudomonadota bacterium]|nr:DnaJ domain-containing protein [Gammaproteobacteria bacterium]MBU2546731.1 DnaJ domain-containing protein [Gammaproteobacteria bacterium]
MWNEEPKIDSGIKDLYKLLGVTPDASEREIKKAFHKKSLALHPDKGGSNEQMAALNEAYEILKDPEKREKFNFEREQFKDEEDDCPQPVAGFIKNDWIAFSLQFKQLHTSLMSQYSSEPPRFNEANHFKPYKTDLYESYPDLFTFIRAKSARSTSYVSSNQVPESINPGLAIEILTDFLQGKYYGMVLTNKAAYLSTELGRVKTIMPYAPALKLYEGILELFERAQCQEENTQSEAVLSALKKITDYAKQTDMLSIPFVAPLLQNKYFRHLYTHTLNQYWLSDHRKLEPQTLEPFNGVKATKEILDSLRLQLSRSSGISEELKALISTVKTLYKFEKDLAKDAEAERPADFYRERAYHLLDWFPAFSGMINSQVMINVFLRIGIYFQLASQLADRSSIQAADEQLALQMYLSAFGIAHHATPDVELYVYVHGLKQIAAFKYQHPHLPEMIQAFQSRALKIADVFPIHTPLSPNIDFMVKGQQSLGLMRNLLHTLIQVIEDNRAGNSDIHIDHDYVTVLYQAYEACLKHWYEEKYDPASEQKIRLALMDEMLLKKGWTFLDLEENLNSPWIMLNQDEEGWMAPSKLPWQETSSVKTYRSLNGLQLNYKTGKLEFLFKKVAANDLEYTRVISEFDLTEMLERNIQGAVFSLDPVDPEIIYHPFNKMRFAPDSVYKTEFFNTMLLTDYILKFLTTGREVQGQYPYATRSLERITAHLPLYLKKIITDFHESQHSESLHRFWIEAEEIPVALDETDIEKTGARRVAVGDLKMVVKKHVMGRDEHGELIDIEEHDEGWKIYVISKTAKAKLDKTRNYGAIQSPAIIFIEKEEQFYFLDSSNEISQSFFMPRQRRLLEKLIRLSKMERRANGEVIKTQKNTYWLYKLTRDVTEFRHKPHKFSPEYVFAHEFTAHYNEFAQYFPEFGRLRELSRITVLIKFMNGLRGNNKENVAKLDDALNDVPHWQARGNEISRAIQQVRQKYTDDYNQGSTQVLNQLNTEFSRLSGEISKIPGRKKQSLREIKNQIGSFSFSTDSNEVNEVYSANYTRIKNEVESSHGYSAWYQVESEVRSKLNSQRYEIAEQLSQAKRAGYRQQLIQLFGDRLSWDIDRFIEGDLSYLANSLAREEQAEAEKQIRKSFPDQSTSDVDAALKNDRNAIARMARKAVDKQFSQYKSQVETEVKKAEQVVPNEKKALRDQRDELSRVEKIFSDLRFGADVPETESAKRAQQDYLSKQCFWVLSSVHHNPNGSRIVYGGVHVEPQVNVLPSGSSQHQNLVNSTSENSHVDSRNISHAGRAGRQARLRELAEFDKLGSADRGWLKQEINRVNNGSRDTIRVPRGKELAHERGREAAKGYSYQHSNLQDADLHRLQHKYDDKGRANKERPINNSRRG